MSTSTATSTSEPPASSPPAPATPAPASPPGPERLYWSSGGVSCPARLARDHGDGHCDLFVLKPDGTPEALHRVPHAAGPGSWGFPDEDPGKGPNGDVLRAGGLPIAVGATVYFDDPRRGPRKAVIRWVELSGSNGRREARVDLQRVDGDSPDTLSRIVELALEVPDGFQPGRRKDGVDLAGVRFGYGAGQWCWSPG